ncbi:MAG: hypothetical protein MjAS7_2016 [Metallosphaera javensis (ex Sakai et al. 2022)]|nr:MAG: hypothetical protein MjAS7_2016 [Metallosphaera javensis (ex Sakai et al. 2022)]
MMSFKPSKDLYKHKALKDMHESELRFKPSKDLYKPSKERKQYVTF